MGAVMPRPMFYHPAVTAAHVLQGHCIAIVLWYRQHRWAVRRVSVTTAESPTSAGHCPLLGAGRDQMPPCMSLLMLRDKDVIMHPVDKGDKCPLTSFHC